MTICVRSSAIIPNVRQQNTRGPVLVATEKMSVARSDSMPTVRQATIIRPRTVWQPTISHTTLIRTIQHQNQVNRSATRPPRVTVYDITPPPLCSRQHPSHSFAHTAAQAFAKSRYDRSCRPRSDVRCSTCAAVATPPSR